MKKILAMVMAAAILVSAAACGKKAPAAPALKEGITLQKVVDGVSEEYELAMPAPVDDTILKDMISIDPADVAEYAGYIAMVNVSADNLIAVKAKEGKIDTVKKGLEGRLEFMQKMFEQYLPDQYAKTKAGKVFVMGDYAFLVIMGRGDKDPGAEVTAIEAKIKESFDNVA